MSRRQRRSARPFENLGPLETPIPISTGYARLSRENDGSVLLDINGMPSSHLHPDPEFLVFEYMRWMQLVIELQLAAGDVRSSAPQLAHLGGGGCSLPRALAAAHPDSRQIVVELDALLAEQVRPWFDLPRSPQLRLRVDDALGALSAWRADRFDVLVRDVFSGSVTPPSCSPSTPPGRWHGCCGRTACTWPTAPLPRAAGCWPMKSPPCARSSSTSA